MRKVVRAIDRLPITLKVPIVVALLMLAVSVVASERVLSRLSVTQSRQIDDLTNAYLDGLASPLIEPVLRNDPWEIFDLLDQSRQAYASVRPVETVVTDATGRVLAASNPRHAAIGSELPPEFPVDSTTGVSKVFVRDLESRAFVNRKLVVEGRDIGALHAEFDISPLLAERRAVFWTLLSTNAALTFLFVVLGWFAVRRMVRPMKVLTDHLENSQNGGVQPIAEAALLSSENEAGRLFRQFNHMAKAVRENESLAARLADEERLASLGRLASGMAHEINNPLGGLFNALDTLKKHGEKPMVRATSLPLIERGLAGIKEVVQAALATYRTSEPRTFTVRDFEDVKVLLGPELRRRHQSIEWRVPDGMPSDFPATPLRQALLNLMLNASYAAGEKGRIEFVAEVDEADALDISVGDSGLGMPDSAAGILTGERTYAMLRDGRGLGLWMVRRLVDELGGRIEVGRSALGGAEVRLRFALGRPNVATAHVA